MRIPCKRAIYTARGFTLIEVLLYSVLLSFLISTTIAFNFSVSDATVRIAKQFAIEDDARFVIDKINYIFSDAVASGITITASELIVTKPNVVHCLAYDAFLKRITLDQGGSVCPGNPQSLVPYGVNVTSVSFKRELKSGRTVVSLEFEINGKLFSSRLYPR